MSDHTARLPPELRRMICELIPRNSLKDVRLVSQKWSHAAATLLWHTFATDLSNTGTRRFDALLTSQHGGFLDSVRKLHIKTATPSSPQIDERLIQLLSLLPRGSLQKFIVDHAIDSGTLGVLLIRQPNLHELSSPIKRFTTPPGVSYVAGKLARMNVLTIFANDSQDGYDVWFPYTPNLYSLTVSGTLPNHNSIFEPWGAESRLKKLRDLYLNNLEFVSTAGVLDSWLDLNCLETLTLRNCTNVDLFLESLAEAYTAHGISALKSFKMFSEGISEEWTDELETFLSAVRGLDYLYVSASTDQRLDPHSICNQASSLQYLVIEYLSSWDQEDDDVDCIYNATELKCLSKACPHIEELGISCAQINFIEWPTLEPFVWSSAAMRSQKEKEIIQFLDVIVTFPKLRVLRMTQSALDVMDDGSNGPFLERQWRYQQYAQQILAYLVERNSSVELLVFSPTRVSRNMPSSVPDANDHKWPHYYYVRAESETVLPRGSSKKQVVAVPVKPTEISNYVEEPRILVDPEKV